VILSHFLLAATLQASHQTPTSQGAVLPGLLPSGEVQLPNQWKLNPVGSHVGLGDFPVQIALSSDAKYAAVLHRNTPPCCTRVTGSTRWRWSP